MPASWSPARESYYALTQAVLNLIVNAGEAMPPLDEVAEKAGTVEIRGEALDAATSAPIA